MITIRRITNGEIMTNGKNKNIYILGILAMLLLLFTVPITTASTIIVFPIEDTYIDSSYPNDNFAGSSYISASAAIYYSMPNEREIILLKYNIPTLPNGAIIESAKLRPYAMTTSSTTPHIAVYSSSNNDWNPITTTWNNFQMGNLVYLSEISVPYADTRYELDVKNAIKNGGTVTIVMKSTRTDPGYESATFYSTNSYDISKKPIINITYSIPNIPSSVTVTSPNGGENWLRGTTHTLKWTKTGNPGANVKIELLKSGTVVGIYSLNTPNDGSYDWTISPARAIGTDYKVRVTSTDNPAYTDTSDGNFIISSAGSSSITVTSPNGGENWLRGTTHTLKWTKTGNPGANVKIELLKGTAVNRVILLSTPNDGSQTWTVPSTQILGNDYKIRVTSTSNGAYKDTSNNNFVIISSAPSIRVVSPNGGESWTRGSTKLITWVRTGSTGANVRIQLYKGSTLVRTISPGTPNDGSFGWSIPLTQTIGNDYKIKISSTTASYNDWSNSNFRIY